MATPVTDRAGREDRREIVRRLGTLIETVHAIVYFAPEAQDAYRALGLRGYWRGYFAALFAGFAPGMVSRAAPEVWAVAALSTATRPMAAAHRALRGRRRRADLARTIPAPRRGRRRRASRSTADGMTRPGASPPNGSAAVRSPTSRRRPTGSPHPPSPSSTTRPSPGSGPHSSRWPPAVPRSCPTPTRWPSNHCDLAVRDSSKVPRARSSRPAARRGQMSPSGSYGSSGSLSHARWSAPGGSLPAFLKAFSTIREVAASA